MTPNTPHSTRTSSGVSDDVEQTAVQGLAKCGPYKLLGEISRGGMGVVYRARDPKLHRVVALKMLATLSGVASVETGRFLREARAVAGLSHPHIIPIYHLDEDNGRPYFVMEYAEGGSLAQHRERYLQDPFAAVVLVEKVARAVHFAHVNQVLHRDLKPGNILLTAAGEPLVADFGLAKLLDTESDLTVTGIVIGTPAYMSPEQAAGHGNRVGPATDIWSIGVILFELLTGQRPFLGKSREEVTPQILNEQPPHPLQLRADAPAPLAAIVLRCLMKDPQGRYGSAEALAEDLARWRRGETLAGSEPPARRVRRVWLRAGAILLSIATAAAIATSLWMRQTEGDHRHEAANLIAQQLFSGEPVDLLHPDGTPKCGRVAAGQLTLLTRDANLELQANESGLFELLAAPNCGRYRFSVEVLQGPTADGDVGLYVGQSKPTPAMDWCICHSFADQGFLAANDQTAEGKPRGRAGAVLRGIPVARGEPVRWAFTKATMPFLSQPGTWRRLAVDVETSELRIYWDDQFAGRVPGHELHDWARAQQPGGRGPLGPPFPTLSPHQGIGLYVAHGSASFRRALLVPLRD